MKLTMNWAQRSILVITAVVLVLQVNANWNFRGSAAPLTLLLIGTIVAGLLLFLATTRYSREETRKPKRMKPINIPQKLVLVVGVICLIFISLYPPTTLISLKHKVLSVEKADSVLVSAYEMLLIESAKGSPTLREQYEHSLDSKGNIESEGNPFAGIAPVKQTATEFLRRDVSEMSNEELLAISRGETPPIPKKSSSRFTLEELLEEKERRASIVEMFNDKLFLIAGLPPGKKIYSPEVLREARLNIMGKLRDVIMSKYTMPDYGLLLIYIGGDIVATIVLFFAFAGYKKD